MMAGFIWMGAFKIKKKYVFTNLNVYGWTGPKTVYNLLSIVRNLHVYYLVNMCDLDFLL